MRQRILTGVPMTTSYAAITLPENMSANNVAITMENGSPWHMSETGDDTQSFPFRENQGVNLSGFIEKGKRVCYARVDSGTDTARIVVTM